MAVDSDRVRNFACSYADAWCSHDPVKVASHYVPGGTIAINGGEPTEIMEVAHSFISAFPDIQVFVDDLIFKDETVEFRWTFTGTNTGPRGTGKWVRIPGWEEWTFGPTVWSSDRSATMTKTSTTVRSSTVRRSSNRP